MSFEAIIFFYARTQNKEIREKIFYFFAELNHLQVDINGDDLRELGIEPGIVYNDILKRMILDKVDGKVLLVRACFKKVLFYSSKENLNLL